MLVIPQKFVGDLQLMIMITFEMYCNDRGFLYRFTLLCDFTYVCFALSKPIRTLDPSLVRKKPYVLFLRLAVTFNNMIHPLTRTNN